MSTLITPSAGNVYSFKFKSGYNTFDGVYRVLKIMMYDEYVNDGGDIDNDFFAPNDASDNLDAELDNVLNSKILKLIPPDNDDADPIFVPLYYLAETPDYNVKEYKNLGIIAKIGITESANDVMFISDIITEAVESAIGITPEPKLVVIDSKWMTESQYEDLKAERDENKMKVKNYYSENIKLEKRLAQVNTIITEYEKLIINLQNQVDSLKLRLGDE